MSVTATRNKSSHFMQQKKPAPICTTRVQSGAGLFLSKARLLIESDYVLGLFIRMDKHFFQLAFHEGDFHGHAAVEA